MLLYNMLFRSLLFVGATALSASALVVPDTEGDIAPIGSGADGDIGIIDSGVEILDAKQEQVTLRCTECPFLEANQVGESSWSDGFETSLVHLVSLPTFPTVLLTIPADAQLFREPRFYAGQRSPGLPARFTSDPR